MKEISALFVSVPWQLIVWSQSTEAAPGNETFRNENKPEQYFHTKLDEIHIQQKVSSNITAMWSEALLAAY
jgi:hypothetical protein